MMPSGSNPAVTAIRSDTLTAVTSSIPVTWVSGDLYAFSFDFYGIPGADSIVWTAVSADGSYSTSGRTYRAIYLVPPAPPAATGTQDSPPARPIATSTPI